MSWKFEKCSGALRYKDQGPISVNFSLECQPDGKIKIKVNPIQFTKKNNWLFFLSHSNEGIFLPKISLSGKNSDGHLIQSDHVYIVGSSVEQKPGIKALFLLELDCAELAISLPSLERKIDRKDTAKLIFEISGFRCFSIIGVNTEIGEIKAGGSSKIQEYDKITGFISIASNQFENLQNWEKLSDEQIERILDIFSLAGGRYIDWARRTLWVGEKWVETKFRSPLKRGKPTQPVFHYLNMQPILELAINNYTNTMKFDYGFGIALEQFLEYSLYVESNFAMSFMALEHFVNTYSAINGWNRIMDWGNFDEYVVPEIKTALKNAKKMMKELQIHDYCNDRSIKREFKAISGKIKELNRYPFERNLMKFLKDIQVPIDDLDKNEIQKIIQSRHEIIHSGTTSLEHPSSNGKQEKLALLRELLIRIFLSYLQYNGKYSSYLDGHQFKKFPPQGTVK